MHCWLYLKDEWAKDHPVFHELPIGLMDYKYYRQIIPDIAWQNIEPPAEVVAGAVQTTLGYQSGLMLAVYRFGQGKFILNTLRIAENLGTDPVAEKLLRNILLYAAADMKKPLANIPDDFQKQLQQIGYHK